MPKTLSVVVLTYNNEDIIERFVRSAAWADELVVVDSGSSDNTVALATKNHPNCRVVVRSLDSFAAQRNFGLDNATGDWVMHCDSDYILPESLRDEVVELLGNETPSHGAYNVVLRLYWRSQALKHVWGPVGFGAFMHRREMGRFTGRIHETLLCKCPVGMLRSHALHITDKPFDKLIGQTIRYASNEVDAILAGERTICAGKFNIFWRPVRRLIYAFCLRGAYRDGIPGMAWAVVIAFRTFLIQFIYWQTQQNFWRDYEEGD